MISRRTYLFIERLIIVGMVAGIIGMFQPFSIQIYGIGFHVLLVCTLAFIVFTKIPVKAEEN
jgi:hypothetical protein